MTQSFNAELWRQADSVLDGLLDLPADERLPRLAGMDLADEVRARARRLLDGLEKSGPLDAGSLTLLGMEASPAAQGMEGREIGPYRLESLIGHGGMSTVYRARRTDGSYDTPVAVKILNSALLATDWKERFRREARYLAQLRHPGIATLLDAGVSDDGTPYLVTELVDGQPIHQHCHDTQPDIRARVELMHQLCKAVAFAQERLIVHRDIKPENVMVSGGDRVKLMDFGIAKPLAEDGEDPATVTRVFTPESAAPEQLAGEPATTASDVFSLGAVFYHLLTGESPFARTSGGRAANTPVSPPSKRTITRDELPAAERKQRARLLRGDLDNIVRKALEETPERRYPNAQAMSNDLAAWLEHRPVSAHAPAITYRARLFAKRRPALTGALAAVFLVSAAGIGATLWQARQKGLQAEQALIQSQHAQAVSDFMVQLFEAIDPDVARGQMPTARDLLDLGAHQIDSSFADTPALRARTLVLLGHLYSRIGEYGEARSRLAESLILADAAGEPDVRVDALYRAGQLEIESGHHQDAVILLEQAEELLSATGNIPGRRHAQVLRSLVSALSSMGDRQEAVERADRALIQARTAPSLPESALADYLYAMVDALTGVEQLDRAETLLREAMALDVFHTLAPSYRISVLAELSGILVGKGRYEDALATERQAMDLADLIYPRDHVRRARILQNLGQVLGEAGEIDQALSALNEALEILQAHYPENSFELVAIHNNLGNTYFSGRQLDQAEQHLQQATRMAGQLLGHDDPAYATAALNLSNVLFKRGQHDEAIAAAYQALETRRAAFGPDHHLIGATHVFLVNPYIALDQPADALAHADAALQLYRDLGWESPRDLLSALSLRARALQAIGDHEQTNSAYLEALAFGEAEMANVGVRWPILLGRYAQFLTERNAPEAPAMTLRALEAHHEVYGHDHPSTRRIEALVRDTPPER